MDKTYAVYFLTNSINTVIYIGVTSNLAKRIYEHKHNLSPGFTSRYHVKKLVHYELFSDVNLAIAREKQLKGGSRQQKLEIIKTHNPQFNDLYISIL